MKKNKPEQLFNMIKTSIDNGIHLGYKIKNKEQYLLNLCNFFNLKKYVRAYYEGNVIVIEDELFRPIVSIKVSDDTLYLLPLGEDNFFSCYLDVLKFVSSPRPQKVEQKIDENEFEWI